MKNLEFVNARELKWSSTTFNNSKMEQPNQLVVQEDRIEARILFIRGKKVIMDRDLAVLYGVETKVLNQAVKRNISRFPADFMFQLSKEEMTIWGARDGLFNTKNWKSQIVTSNFNAMGLRKRPFAFTEQGVAMLSSVLRSERAIQVNIQIMRTFTKLREMLASNRELREKIENLEKKFDGQFKIIFKVIKQLLAADETPKESIGYKLPL